jgi:hypothetical protein
MSKLLLIPLSFWLVFLFVQPFTCRAELQSIQLNAAESASIHRGEIIVREIVDTSRPGKTFEALGLIRASMVELYDLLIDFENYPAFMPNVKTIEVLESTDKDAVINYTLALPLGKKKQYRLAMQFCMKETAADISWKMVDWPDLNKKNSIKDTTGYWMVRQDAEQKDHLLVLYHVYTDPGPIPLGLGWIVTILSEKSVPKTLSQTRKRLLTKEEK